MSTTYQVVIDLSTKGDLGKGVGRAQGTLVKADQAAGKFMQSMRTMGSSMMRPFDMVASKMYEVGSAAAKVGVAAALGLATYGVVKYNNELEKTRIQLGAIFTAAGVSSNIHTGLDMAGKTMEQMRKDAASLPGEFSDLMGIFATISTSGFKAGASTNELRTLSAKAMATGATVGLPLEQVGNQLAMLIEGRAGVDNVFGMRVAGLGGDAAAEFNKLDPAERLKRIGTELDRFAPAIQIYKTSFEGMSSTMIDNAKSLLGKVTEPIFDKVKSSLMFINEWFDGNENFLKTKADAIGSKLAYAFDQGKTALAEWWPAIETFGQNAYSKLVEIWKDMGPAMKSAGEALKNFLKDPGAVDKIITVMKLYAGAKVGGSLLGGGMDFAGNAGNMIGAAKGMGWIGGAAQGAGAAGGVVGGAGAVAGSAKGLSVLGAAALKLAPTLLWVAAAVGTTAMAYDQGSKLYKEASADSVMNSQAAFTYGAETVERFGGALDAASYRVEATTGVLGHYLATQQHVAASSLMAGMAAAEMAIAAREAADALGSVSANAALAGMTMITTANNAKFLRGEAVGPEKPKGKGPKHGGGGGGTTVQKVEIVVTSNQDPSRIARAVMGEIQNLQRHPRVSRGVPNYSGSGS